MKQREPQAEKRRVEAWPPRGVFGSLAEERCQWKRQPEKRRDEASRKRGVVCSLAEERRQWEVQATIEDQTSIEQ